MITESDMYYTIGLKQLPFKWNPFQVIYVESGYNEKVNSFIQANYKVIKQSFNKRGFDFCYLPILSKEIESIEVIQYYAPYETNLNKDTIRHLGLQSDYLLQFMSHPENRSKIPPSLLYWNNFMLFLKDDVTDCVYRGMSLDMEVLDKYSSDFDLLVWDILDDISQCVNRNDAIRFSIAEYDDTPDDRFDKETAQLMQEIREKIEKLRQRGVAEFFIKKLIHNEEKLSRLLITEDKRIILVDYDNMEIHMAPLPKAVFFLFLKHPEGIVFKNLSEYHSELVEIYTDLRPMNFFSFRAKESINAVTTTASNNSMNEKCTRIKEAFLEKFDERIAHNYYIEGKRGEAKKIVLPRELVIWE